MVFIQKATLLIAATHLDLSKLHSVVKKSLLLLLTLICLNQYSDFISPRALTQADSLDENQVAFMLAKPGTWNLDHGQGSFHTYGPLYRYFKYSVGPHSDGHFLSLRMLPFIWAMIIVIFALYAKSIFILSLAIVYVSLFRFPFFHNVPILFWVWSLSYGASERSQRQVLLVLWSLYVAFLFNYKFSWAVAGGLQVFITLTCYSISLKHAAKTLMVALLMFFFFALLFYGISTGQVLTFIDYLRFSLIDTSSYSDSMVLMQSRPWTAALTYPPLVAILWVITFLSNPSYRKPLLCSLPLLLVLFKYSWVRADYDNARVFICYVPVMAMWLFFKQKKSWSMIAAFSGFTVLSVGLASEMMSKATFPMFATRQFNLPLLLNYSERFEREKQRSCAAFSKASEAVLSMDLSLKDDALLSLPILTHHAIAADKAMVLPSNQYFYRFNDAALVERDIALLNEHQPSILFKDASLHQQPPMAYGQDFWLSCLKNYTIEKLDAPWFSMKPSSLSHHWQRQELEPETSIDSGGRVHAFDSPQNAILYLSSKDLKGQLYALKRTFLKGDRVLLEHRCGDHSREYQVPVPMFEQGFILYDDLSQLKEQGQTIRHHIVIKGFLSDQHPYDYSHYFSALNRDFSLVARSLVLRLN